MEWKKSVECVILKQTQIHQNLFDMTVQSATIASHAIVGQFLHIKTSGGYLRRPISICDVMGDFVRFIYEVKGEGLLSLSKMQAGESINILGPLGNGFDLSIEAKNPYIVGGGIGIFPLFYLAKQRLVKAVFGFRTRDLICMEDEFKVICPEVSIATDDGSVGIHGNVCDVLNQKIKDGDIPDLIYVCGPLPMLKAICALAKENGIRAQVSLEERMACGIGACLGCATKTKQEDGTEGYLHVCKNGPVFDAEKVIF